MAWVIYHRAGFGFRSGTLKTILLALARLSIASFSSMSVTTLAGQIRCKNPVLARNEANIEACRQQQTCISKEKIKYLKDHRRFPIFGRSFEHLLKGPCEMNESAKVIAEFSHQVEKYAFAPETKLAADLKDRLALRIKAILDVSKTRMDSVNFCVTALIDNQQYLKNGAFDVSETTKSFLKNRNKIPTDCAGLWDKSFSARPLVAVLTDEVRKARLYLALSKNWNSPESLSVLEAPQPLVKGTFFQDLPAKLASLSADEVRSLVKTRDDLKADCEIQMTQQCNTAEALRDFSYHKYQQHISENPIVLYFSEATSSDKFLDPKNIGIAYNRHRKKMDTLAEYALSDQDYFHFTSLLDAELKETAPEIRGDYCEVISAIYDNLQSKDRGQSLLAAATFLPAIRGVMAAKTILTRGLAVITGGSTALIHFNILENIVSLHSFQMKVENLCSGRHLKDSSTALCNVSTISANSNEVVKLGASVTVLNALAAFGLFSEAMRLANHFQNFK